MSYFMKNKHSQKFAQKGPKLVGLFIPSQMLTFQKSVKSDFFA